MGEIRRISDMERELHGQVDRLSAQVDEQGKQVVALRDRAIAAEAEVARLRAAVVALVDAEAHGIPGGYINMYPDETDRYCTYCFTSWRMGEPERHDDDCPIAAARRALEGGA